MSEIVVVDDLSFEVRRSDRRTTVGLTIDRGGELVLSVPSDCPIETARQIAGAKRLWIYTKLAQRERLAGALTAREFVTGEGFSYLGRTYRLKLVDPSGAVRVLESPSTGYQKRSPATNTLGLSRNCASSPPLTVVMYSNCFVFSAIGSPSLSG